MANWFFQLIQRSLNFWVSAFDLDSQSFPFLCLLFHLLPDFLSDIVKCWILELNHVLILKFIRILLFFIHHSKQVLVKRLQFNFCYYRQLLLNLKDNLYQFDEISFLLRSEKSWQVEHIVGNPFKSWPVSVTRLIVDKVHNIFFKQLKTYFGYMNNCILVKVACDLLLDLRLLFCDSGTVSKVLKDPYQLFVEQKLFSELFLDWLNVIWVITVKCVPFPVKYCYFLNVHHVFTLLKHLVNAKKLINDFNLGQSSLGFELYAGMIWIDRWVVFLFDGVLKFEIFQLRKWTVFMRISSFIHFFSARTLTIAFFVLIGVSFVKKPLWNLIVWKASPGKFWIEWFTNFGC